MFVLLVRVLAGLGGQCGSRVCKGIEMFLFPSGQQTAPRRWQTRRGSPHSSAVVQTRCERRNCRHWRDKTG